MPDIEPHPLIDTLTALYCREGSPFAAEDKAVQRVRLAWEWASGQWVMVTGADDALWGWASWYRTDDAGLAIIRHGAAEDAVRQGIPVVVWDGPHVYVATVVVAPWAPASTYRRLYELVKASNRDAQDISGHMVKRDGRILFHSRPIRSDA